MSQQTTTILNSAQACAVLGVCRRTLRRMALRGQIMVAVRATGRGNRTRYAIPPELMPAGFNWAMFQKMEAKK